MPVPPPWLRTTAWQSLNPASADVVDRRLAAPDEQAGIPDATLAIIAEHYRFIDGQQRHELGSLESRSTWRTTTTALLAGALVVSLQRLDTAHISGGWVVLLTIGLIVYVSALAAIGIASVNIMRGSADDLAISAEAMWNRLVDLDSTDVRYQITRSLVVSCSRAEALIRWKRRWTMVVNIAMVIQIVSAVGVVVLQTYASR